MTDVPLTATTIQRPVEAAANPQSPTPIPDPYPPTPDPRPLMKILDRYLLRQFLQTFLICYFSLTGLYVVFDVFTNLDGFLRGAEKAGGLLALVWSFYSYQAIVFFERSSGLLALVAGMFTMAWIQRHNEMTALMAAGISRIRVVVPVIAAAAAIAGFSMGVRELIIPRFRDQLARKPTDPVGDLGQTMQMIYDNETNVVLHGKHTFLEGKRIEAPSFLLPAALSRYGSRIVAREAFYLPPEGGRPGGYLLDVVSEPAGLAEKPSLKLGERVVVVTPGDAPWLRPNQCFVASNVTFEQLSGGRTFREFASTPELIAAVRNPSLDFGADVRVAIHGRLVQPLLDMTLLMLGLPLVVTRVDRNVFVAIGMCLGLVTLFLLVVIGFQYLASSYLLRSPALAAWAPLMIFVPAATWLSGTMFE
jgi:lipopolysaccharide export system permease protein